ncbi:MAG: metallophosphoesterase [Candidatus Marinimicrobia bacterium]|nr:metallophosphoesterase [Candidatus Neomarinimicrobiota bacterium]
MKHLRPQVEGITPPFYFFSDTHISSRQGEAQKRRMEKLLQHLEKIKETGGTLFILGDFFDFWFDCRNYIPEAFKPLIDMLSALRKKGIEIHYVGGNHDYWVRGYLTRNSVSVFIPMRSHLRMKQQNFIVSMVMRLSTTIPFIHISGKFCVPPLPLHC